MKDDRTKVNIKVVSLIMMKVMRKQANQSSEKTKSLTLIEAIKEGLKTVLAHDKNTLLLGEDIGVNGGVFRATDGLQKQFGEERVVDTPLSEAGFVGAARSE